MSNYLEVPVRPRDAWKALWAALRGRCHFMRVEIIADRVWVVHK